MPIDICHGIKPFPVRGGKRVNAIPNKGQFVVSNRDIKRFRLKEKKNIANQRKMPRYDFSGMKRLLEIKPIE